MGGLNLLKATKINLKKIYVLIVETIAHKLKM